MNKGFSLIEVLVVALIIVTLALVARPLYENAVWKSRAQSLQIAVRNVAEAQERYRLANGECAQTFGELDMSVDSLPQTTLGLSTTFFMLYGIRPLSEDAVRGNDFFEVALGGFTASSNDVCWTLGRFKKGPWKGGQLVAPEGIAFPHEDYRLNSAMLKHLYCIEGNSDTHRFCQQLLNVSTDRAQFFNPSSPGNRLYKLQ